MVVAVTTSSQPSLSTSATTTSRSLVGSRNPCEEPSQPGIAGDIALAAAISDGGTLIDVLALVEARSISTPPSFTYSTLRRPPAKVKGVLRTHTRSISPSLSRSPHAKSFSSGSAVVRDAVFCPAPVGMRIPESLTNAAHCAAAPPVSSPETVTEKNASESVRQARDGRIDPAMGI